jgi:hypothetical protein
MLRSPENVLEIAPEVEASKDEISNDSFDRAAFAMRALELLSLPKTTVAICPGARRLRVESGRAWGRGEGARWAVLAIPSSASKRAIALAIAQLATSGDARSVMPSSAPARPYALDVLLGDLGLQSGGSRGHE